MIILAFNTNGFEDYKHDLDIIHEDAVILEMTGFDLPVTFIVNGVNLFEIIRSQVVLTSDIETHSLEPITREIIYSELSLPILHFATTGLEAAQKVCKGETADLSLAETGSYLRFSPVGGRVEIYSDINKRTVMAELVELLNAFENFFITMQNALRNEVPQLLDHPYLGSWLKGK
jgi:hypothetical protein